MLAPLYLYLLSVDDKSRLTFANPTSLEDHLTNFYTVFPNEIFPFAELDVGIHELAFVQSTRHHIVSDEKEDALFLNTLTPETLLREALPISSSVPILVYPKLFSYALGGSKVHLVDRKNIGHSEQLIRVKHYNMSLERVTKSSAVSFDNIASSAFNGYVFTIVSFCLHRTPFSSLIYAYLR